MVRVFIETSVWIRFLSRDDENKFKDTYKLLEKINLGKIIPYISSIVVLEIYFVLFSVYKFEKKKILEAIKKIVGVKNMVVVEKTDLSQALKMVNKTGVKLSDAMIASQAPKGVGLCSYDEEMVKIPSFKVIKPADLVK